MGVVRNMKNMEEPEPGQQYRIKKISARTGWALAQIKFEYTDGKTWSVGVDSGRKDNRRYIMTEGEYIIRVTHEKLPQRWYAGASVEFVTFKADQGKEIIMLKIKHGCLEGIIQQTVPTLEVIEKKKEWFASACADGKVEEFSTRSSAKEFFRKLPNGILIDVLKNKIVKTNGNTETKEICKAIAVKKGFFVDSVQEAGGFKDVLSIFWRYFDVEKDTLYFIITLTLITLAHYIGGYSEILSGHALSNFANTNEESVKELTVPNFVCNNIYGCETASDARKVLILSLLVTKLSSTLLFAGNVFFHS